MRFFALGVALGFVFTACEAPPPVPAPDELVAGIRAVGSLDPLTVSSQGDERLVGHQIFEGLTSYDPATLEVEPALAAQWTVDPSARTFTFLLRPDATFHDGRPVTAADAVASLNRLARAACASPTAPEAGAPAFLLSLVVGYAPVASACEETALAGVVAVSDNTLSIALSEPWGDFPSVLAHPAAAVVPGGEADADDPVGTGPYRISQPWDGRTVRLERFDDYWGPSADVPRLRFVGYEDDSAAYFDLLGGDLHYAPVPINRARAARRRFGDDGFTLETGLAFFGFNLRSPKVQHPEFRAGLSRAIDRESLADGIYEGTREPANGIASPALPGAGENVCGDPCSYDPRAAQASIRAAYPDGVVPELLIGTSDEGSNPAVAEAVVEMLGRVGVSARVLERPFVEHVKGVQAGDVDLFQYGWVPAYPTLDGMFRQLFRSTSPDNLMGYANADVDRLLSEARGILDDAERYQRYRQVEDLILRDLPVLPLLWYRTAIAFDPRLTAGDGVRVSALGLTDFARLRFEGEGG